VEIPRDKLLEMYRKLLLARYTDDKLFELNSTGAFTGWLHLAGGQEAMPVAVGAALRRDDYLKASRAFPATVAKGVPLVAIFAGMMSKGPAQAGGHVHGASPEYGMMGSSHSIGEDVPIYVGIALSMKIQRKDRVTVCFFGDGTANRAPVHEAMNMAAIWKLPIVFICENNQFAISMPRDKAIAATSIADRAVGYGMPGIEVDGNDLIACYEVVCAAVARARAGDGPTFIEAKTYRLRGHWEGDPETYRPKEEVAEARKRDPLTTYRERLVRMGVLTAEEADRIAFEAKAEVDRAAEEAIALPQEAQPAFVRALISPS